MAEERGQATCSLSSRTSLPCSPLVLSVLLIPTQKRVDISALLHRFFSWLPFSPFQNLLPH